MGSEHEASLRQSLNMKKTLRKISKWSSRAWFQSSWSDYVAAFLILGIIPCSIVLAGCSYSTLPSIYLFRIDKSSIEVRVGMLGTCARFNNGPWSCGKIVRDLEASISISDEELSILPFAQTLRTSLAFPHSIMIALVLIAFAVILLCTFPRWHEETDERTGSIVDVKPFPSRPVMIVVFNLMFMAAIFLVVSILWQVTASNAVQVISANSGYAGQASDITRVLTGVTTAIFGLSALSMLAYIMILSSLDSLTDDNDDDTASTGKSNVEDGVQANSSQAASQAGSPAASRTGTSTGYVTEPSTGYLSETRTGSQTGSQTRSQAESRAESRAESQAESQAKSQSGSQATSQASAQLEKSNITGRAKERSTGRLSSHHSQAELENRADVQ